VQVTARVAAAFLMLLSAGGALASDIYVVRFNTDIVYESSTDCYRVGWRDHLLFRNSTNQDLTVRALATSNGYALSSPEPLLVPARRSRSLLIARRGGEGGGTTNWTPGGFSVFVLNRLDVPAGVLVESRGELWGHVHTPFPCQAFPSSLPEVFGTMPLPVVRTLTSPGVEQIHLATDIGTQGSRTNVGIYNASSSPANVLIELRRSCDDVAVQTRSVAIPPDTVTQITGLADPGVSGCSVSTTPEYSRYVVVVMDQPGFSFVTTLARDLPPRITVTTSVAR
jgi:hypothetical protein